MTVSKGQAVEMEVPLGDIAVHYRGGAVIPMQPYAKVTRDIRLAPVTLLVTLPAEPAGAAATAGPLPPFAHEEACVAALAENEGQLVSCGLLYMDQGDNIEVSADNTVQVGWSGSILAICQCGLPVVQLRNLTAAVCYNCHTVLSAKRVRNACTG